MFFVHESSGVSYSNYLYRIPWVVSSRSIDVAGYFSVSVDDLQWYAIEDFRFLFNHTYYIKAYGVNYRDGGYPDIETGIRIYPSMNMEGGSNVAMFEPTEPN